MSLQITKVFLKSLNSLLAKTLFVNDLFMWFKLSSARRFDYADVQRQEQLVDAVGQFILKPVSSRWLSNVHGARLPKDT